MQLRDVLKLAKILAKQCGSEEQLTSIISARYMALVGAHQWRWKKKEMVFPLTDYLTGPDDLAQAKIWISTTANETRLYYSGAWFAASSTVPPGYSHDSGPIHRWQGLPARRKCGLQDYRPQYKWSR